MAQFASASFTGTAGDTLPAADANWTKHANSPAGANIIISDANRGRGDAVNANFYYHAGTPASPDYSVSATLFAKEANGGNMGIGVTGRNSTTATTHYLAWYYGAATDRWELYKVVAGAATLLGSSAQALTDETGYQVELRMVGTTIGLYANGSSTPTISVTDSSITAAGKAGLRANQEAGSVGNTVGLHIDDFSADDAVTNRYLLLMGVG